MQKLRRWLSIFLTGAGVLASFEAHAAGFGASSGHATLGQSLDVSVPLRLETGEAPDSACASAEVMIGERRLPPDALRVAVEAIGADGARIRVQSSQIVDEPVLAVTLAWGCSSRISRRFTLFADPPASAAIAAVPAFAGSIAEAPVQGLSGPPAAAASTTGGDASQGPLSAAGPSGASEAVRPASRARAAGVGGRHRVAGSLQTRRPVGLARVRQAVPRVAAAPGEPRGSRLKLDPVDAATSAQSTAVEQAIEAVALASSAARAAASAASAANERAALLERTVEQLRAQAQAQRQAELQLRERLNQTGEGGRWFVPLLVVAGLLALLAAWLAWRVTSLQRRASRPWSLAAAEAAAGSERAGHQPTNGEPYTSLPSPFVTADSTHAARVATSPARSPGRAWPPPAPPDARIAQAIVPPELARYDRPDLGPIAQSGPPPVRMPQTIALAPPTATSISSSLQSAGATAARPPTVTIPLAVSHPVDTSSQRDVTIEELIDLEQQAEFFSVLGQDDAAIELLMEHLRHSGGGSPLPYLKLMEVFHRRGDPVEYERIRQRFNDRFNAYAPKWDAESPPSRSLEDYPGVVPRLQQIWARPLDAMAELEALLFRKSRGDLFDLSAYRDVLFLYALARDLLDREAADTGSIDLLLPMADGSEFSSTAPVPYMGLEGDMSSDFIDFEERPTAPIDFDLTSSTDRPTSIFDPLDDAPGTRRR